MINWFCVALVRLIQVCRELSIFIIVAQIFLQNSTYLVLCKGCIVYIVHQEAGFLKKLYKRIEHELDILLAGK